MGYEGTKDLAKNGYPTLVGRLPAVVGHGAYGLVATDADERPHRILRRFR
jgi:hypothetical protein